MRLVIEIPDEEYELVRHESKSFRTELELMNAIANGIPLPKHHGRLKDVDAFLSKVKADREHSAYLRSWTANDVLTALDNSYAPTIIEAESSLTDIECSFLTKVQNDINRKHRLIESKKAYGKYVGE